MTKLVRVIAALSLALAAFSPRAAFAIDSGDIVVESVKGEVRVTMNGAPASVRAGAVLELPATVDTGRDGAIELRQGATTVSVGPETRLEFPALEKRGAPVDRIVQPRGNAFYNIGKREGRRLRVETPYLVGVIKGTQFNVAAEDESTTISLFEGLLEVRASDDSSVIDLKAGEIAARKRGDKSIGVIKMDAGKSPPPQRSPGGSNGSNGGDSPPGSSQPAPVMGDDVVLADRAFVSGSSGADLEVRSTDSGASAATEVAVNAASPNAVSLDIDVATNVTAASGVDAGASVNVGGAVDAGVEAAVNVTNSAVDAGAAVSVDAGPAAADVGAVASVDLGAGAVEVAANVAVDAGPLNAGVDTVASVDVGAGNVAANVDLGTSVDVGGVTAVDAGAGAAVDLGNNVAANVDAGANVAGVGAAVTTTVDVAAGNIDLGVTVAGVDLGVGLDLGLDDGNNGNGNDVGNTDPSNPASDPAPPAPATPVIDVGGLLDGLLRRPGRK